MSTNSIPDWLKSMPPFNEMVDNSEKFRSSFSKKPKKQSLKKILEYSGYESFRDYVIDVDRYVGRCVRLVKMMSEEKDFYELGENHRWWHKHGLLMELGSDMGHLPFTYLNNGQKSKDDRVQTIERLSKSFKF